MADTNDPLFKVNVSGPIFGACKFRGNTARAMSDCIAAEVSDCQDILQVAIEEEREQCARLMEAGFLATHNPVLLEAAAQIRDRSITSAPEHSK